MKPEGVVEKCSKGSSRGPVITERPDLEERIGEVSGSRRACCYRGLVQLMSEELMKEKMDTDSHSRD